MNIRIDPHTLERAEERGTNEGEIRDVIETGVPIPVKGRRVGKAKVYSFNRVRRGRLYEHKRVEVIYVQDGNDIVTVTAYVFYGRWEQPA